ncbi:hypothetical protein, partial [Metapseudomonas otitidis]|uniref:hypothetical protein n=1 Tax=Metapseudomonas otitidis TaxID=319939 RepID=UPI00244C9BD6
PVAFAAFAGKGNIRIWSTNANEVRAQAIKLGLATTSLYALPPQQPDAVSVPRELLRRLLDSNNRNTFCAGTYLQAHDELSAILSTKNAEEGE